MRKPWIAVFVCEQCKLQITRETVQKNAPRFCSKTCSNKWQHAKGTRRAYFADKTIEEWWKQKYSEEEIEILRKNMHDKVLRDRRRSREERYTPEALEKMSNLAKLSWDEKYGIEKSEKMRLHQSETCGWRGKSIEERYDPEKSKSIREKAAAACKGQKRSLETREKMSLSKHRVMCESPSKNSSWGIKGWYKDFFFRSSYEYFFVKKLEQEGLDINSSLIQESFRIPYDAVDKTRRHYVPDFYVPVQRCVYEVKSLYALQNDPNVAAKHAAAKEYLESQGLTFVIILEEDLHMPKDRRKIRPIIASDPNVQMMATIRNHKDDDDRISKL